jgi:hypothetical protein
MADQCIVAPFTPLPRSFAVFVTSYLLSEARQMKDGAVNDNAFGLDPQYLIFAV